MNCKFCGTLMPDTEDATATCPICGRRQDERPIGELLSENMSGSSAAEEQRDDIKKTSEPKEKKSLLTPLAAIAVAEIGRAHV